jgi:hypothetical protein
MLDPQDIKKLTEYQLDVFKGVFVTKQDNAMLEEKMDNIQNSLDAV